MDQLYMIQVYFSCNVKSSSYRVLNEGHYFCNLWFNDKRFQKCLKPALGNFQNNDVWLGKIKKRYTKHEFNIFIFSLLRVLKINVKHSNVEGNIQFNESNIKIYLQNPPEFRVRLKFKVNMSLISSSTPHLITFL